MELSGSLLPNEARATGSCKFLKEVHAGDTLYSALEIVDLSREGENGLVTARVTVFNQRREIVLSGQHKYLLKAVL
jgi:acyl dehydratase